jgi:hypothetical protein
MGMVKENISGCFFSTGWISQEVPRNACEGFLAGRFGSSALHGRPLAARESVSDVSRELAPSG